MQHRKRRSLQCGRRGRRPGDLVCELGKAQCGTESQSLVEAVQGTSATPWQSRRPETHGHASGGRCGRSCLAVLKEPVIGRPPRWARPCAGSSPGALTGRNGMPLLGLRGLVASHLGPRVTARGGRKWSSVGHARVRAFMRAVQLRAINGLSQPQTFEPHPGRIRSPDMEVTARSDALT